ncbi:bifunctional hydroxymethylpyrimidine kinase/phosphomethylpyrimidine kinase [Roseobacter denitrificans]|uniref:hydroxymethylpyrimidine kinase n=1 Tax=Roseobacter denitrificans (strain ATCC 33942 / OCh 114) TaxID=375451 RepID=Q162K3_ROSDO|nr:bifunctional hydroxymethylpyrimidine kinase/phosphomethylpyrimidine kinase [Roseobacter denitrificans]ABG33090.1 phosphomethylpyrimidine kinase [Roseobacter denitrificans OCh 114]AVL52459.1 bifunctional hydroxymethylpyrimidine kinase/phosphomethylpyrimidine kinase [Roseobacter denitrificans]SFG08150.1 hydroxymethylpyrimidine kinase /phosphomethylpyrimidine kinase [Roseobacter denitrificans OCh 114]
MIPNVLSIAGSDPSGGAGIQADIKAISANGAFAMNAITALTAQNTQGVSGIHLIPPAFVQAQIKAIFDDIRVDAVKIGMIANAVIAAAVADALQGHGDIPIVLDPVMIAKGGAALLEPEAVDTLRCALLPIATVLTPNLPEAAHLLGTDIAKTRDDMAKQGAALCALGPKATLMKGGHLEGSESPDCLVTAETVTWFDAQRTATQNTHGTGCTLSSALAAQLAKGHPPAKAASAAKSYVAQAIAAADALSVGTGHGPTHHLASFYSQRT